MKTEVPVSNQPEHRGFVRRHGLKLLLMTAVLAFVATSPILMLPVSMAVDEFTERRNRIPFESTEWKSSLTSTGETNPIRLRMVDDLLKRHKLVGLTQQELIALLGTPPKTDYFRDYQFVYWLGPERGFMSIDSEWLAVRFGSDHRVSVAGIVRD